MNAKFAATISSFFKYDSYSNADIAKQFKINKSTVARIRKIYNDIRFRTINSKSVPMLSKKHHVSNNIILAIAKVPKY